MAWVGSGIMGLVWAWRSRWPGGWVRRMVHTFFLTTCLDVSIVSEYHYYTGVGICYYCTLVISQQARGFIFTYQRGLIHLVPVILLYGFGRIGLLLLTLFQVESSPPDKRAVERWTRGVPCRMPLTCAMSDAAVRGGASPDGIANRSRVGYWDDAMPGLHQHAISTTAVICHP